MDTITQPGPAEDAMTSLARPGSRPAPQFPTPIRVNGRLFFSRIALERHKAELLAWATGGEAVLSAVPAVDSFVPAPKAATEFGFHRRTLSRRLRATAALPAPTA